MDQLIDYIESNLSLFVPIRVGMLGTGRSIALRPTPGTAPEGYLNGDRLRHFSFQVLVQHDDPKTAYDTIEAIADLLDAAELPVNGAIKCEIYTPPNFVEVTEQGFHVYTALFEAEILKEG